MMGNNFLILHYTPMFVLLYSCLLYLLRVSLTVLTLSMTNKLCRSAVNFTFSNFSLSFYSCDFVNLIEIHYQSCSSFISFCEKYGLRYELFIYTLYATMFKLSEVRFLSCCCLSSVNVYVLCQIFKT